MVTPPAGSVSPGSTVTIVDGEWDADKEEFTCVVPGRLNATESTHAYLSEKVRERERERGRGRERETER
jgi:hypothetical protein